MLSGEKFENIQPGPSSLWKQVSVGLCGVKNIYLFVRSFLDMPKCHRSLQLQKSACPKQNQTGDKRMSRMCTFMEEHSNSLWNPKEAKLTNGFPFLFLWVNYGTN